MRYFTALIILVFIFLPSSLGAIESIAHRGNSSFYPENTISAIKNAWEVGSVIVEVDVRMTSDNFLILYHDAKLDKNRIEKITFDEIRKNIKNVSLLEDAIRIIPANKMLLLDLKDNSEKFLSALNILITSYPSKTNQIIFQSRHLDILEDIRTLFPKSKRIYVTSLKNSESIASPKNSNLIAETLSNYGIDGISAKGRRFINKEYVLAFQKRGILFYIWTINAVDRIQHYKNLGVDGIISDRPKTVLEVLRE